MQIQNANNSLRGALRAACVNGCAHVCVCRTHAMRGLLFDYILASSDLAWPGSRPVSGSGSESGAGMTLTSFALSDPSGGVRVFGLHTYIVVVVDPAVVALVVAVVVLSTPLLLLSWLCCCCCCCCIIGIAQCVLSLNHANFIIIIFNDLSGISRQQKQKQRAAEQQNKQQAESATKTK